MPKHKTNKAQVPQHPTWAWHTNWHPPLGTYLPAVPEPQTHIPPEQSQETNHSVPSLWNAQALGQSLDHRLGNQGAIFVVLNPEGHVHEDCSCPQQFWSLWPHSGQGSHPCALLCSWTLTTPFSAADHGFPRINLPSAVGDKQTNKQIGSKSDCLPLPLQDRVAVSRCPPLEGKGQNKGLVHSLMLTIALFDADPKISTSCDREVSCL